MHTFWNMQCFANFLWEEKEIKPEWKRQFPAVPQDCHWWCWSDSLISAIITQLCRLRGFEVVLAKGSFSWGMPHTDSMITARSTLPWDVQLLSAWLHCRFEQVNSERTEFWFRVEAHMSKSIKGLEVFKRAEMLLRGALQIPYQEPGGT